MPMPVNHTPSSAPYAETPSEEMAYDAKQKEATSPVAADEVYQHDSLSSVAPEAERPPQPSPCARVTTLVLISVALLLTIATAVLLGLNLTMKYGYDSYDNFNVYDAGVAICSIMGLVECGASFVTLIVCLVMTVVRPNRVMANRSTHGMNCLCATIFLLALFSLCDVAAFGIPLSPPATLNRGFASGSIAVAVLATLSKLAYFVALALVKGCC